MDRRKLNPYYKEYGLFSNCAYLLKQVIRYKKALFVITFILFFCTPIQMYSWSYITKLVIDLVTGQYMLSTKVLCALGVSVTILMLLVNFFQGYVQNVSNWMYMLVRMRMVRDKNMKSMTMDFYHLEDQDVLDIYWRAGQACGGTFQGVEGMLRQMSEIVVQLGVVVVGIAILSSLNMWLVLVMILASISNGVASTITSRKSKREVWDVLAPWWRKRWYMDRITSNFDVAKDIRMFSLKDWLMGKYRELNKTRVESEKHNQFLWFWCSMWYTVSWFGVQAFIYGFLIRQIWIGEMTVGNFSLYISSAMTFFGYVDSITGKVAQMMGRNREVNDFRSFMDFDISADKKDGIPVPAMDKYEFTFENVSFKYPGAEKYALKNLNLTLKAGERLAVVGLNGAGKSTFIKLLLRLYVPTEGRILLNGVDILTYSRDSYYSIFAPLFQDVSLFAFPMAENVSMKTPENTDKEKARKNLIDAGMEEKLNSLKDGIDTQLLKVVYDDGVDLSGGEKQKLALARALYKDCPVVVLDEPTAALDALAEGKLYSDFDKLIAGKTSVYISHRLSSTQFCNNVAMFKDGMMVEYGNHKSLLELGGEYAKMFEIQAQYYIEGKEWGNDDVLMEDDHGSK